MHIDVITSLWSDNNYVCAIQLLTNGSLTEPWIRLTHTKKKTIWKGSEMNIFRAKQKQKQRKKKY